jgi:hypothetical protein
MEAGFGGRGYVNPRSNVVDYSGPVGGVGGAVGGVIRAGTLRMVPIERNPSLPSLVGMEGGASMVSVLDPAMRLITGKTVTGQPTSRAWAAFWLAMDILPWVAEAKLGTGPALAEARALSAESHMVSAESRVMSAEAEALETTHIGSSGTAPREPTVTNPTCRGDLCVADVGAHHANLHNPEGPPITNTEFVEASGQPVSRLESPIENAGEATNFLNEGFNGLYEQGRISQPIQASIPTGPLQPGEYLAIVDGPQGGHALHATVTDEVTGRQFLSGGRLVTESEALDIVDNGGKVTTRNQYRIEYYDPQNGVSVQPSSAPKSFIRLN